MTSPSRRQAIVTLAIGANFRARWHALCERNWRRYADRYDFDVICIEEPLDTSQRAQDRSPSWQKCLILSQAFARDYERIIWLDADILINVAAAPNIVIGTPLEKVGAVGGYSTPTRELYQIANARNASYWRARGATAEVDTTPQSYYARHGVPQGNHADVVQAGVLVLSPAHHREVLEATYYQHERRADWDWQHEMPPLSHELLSRDRVHWLDNRFNTIWLLYALLHYPFLFNSPRPPDLRRRLGRALDRRLRIDRLRDARRACATAAFHNSYFLHFAAAFEAAEWVDQTVADWQECILTV